MLHYASSLLRYWIFVLPLNASAQVICTLGSATSSYNAYEDQRPTSDAMQLVKRVSATLTPVCSPKCIAVAIFRNATVPNAVLIADSGGVKMVYSPQFFTALYEKYGEGAIIAVIAHMLGHAVDATAPAGWMKGNWTPELRADAWAGCALANAKLSLTGLEAAFNALWTYPPISHLNWPQRISALRVGYTHCGGDGASFDVRAGGFKRK